MDAGVTETSWLKTVLDAAADAVLVIDPEATVALCNPACERLFGRPVDHLISSDVAALIPDWSRHHSAWQPGDAPTAMTARRGDGTTFTIEVSIGTATRNGRLHAIAVARRVERDQRRLVPMSDTERSFRLLVEGVTDYAIYMLDVDGHVTSWNRGAQHIKYYTAAEILGRHYRVFYPPEACARSEPERNLDVARDEGRYEATGWRLRRDGSRFWAHVVIEPLRDEHGGLIGFAKVTSDISERRRAEQVIREADQRINTLMETVGDGVVLTDRHGRIRTFNLACERLFGYSADEMIGNSITSLLPPSRGDVLDAFFATGESPSAGDRIGSVGEATGLRKDGTLFPMDLSVGETVQEAESVFVAVFHDLTDRKRTEEQLVQAQKMETVGQLSGGIAHDFNNLLTVIIGNAEFLGDQLAAHPDLKALSDDIGRAGQRGAELTQSLLAFSRRQTLKPVELDCNALVEAIHKLLRRTLREDIAIDTPLAPALHGAYADPAQLESAILNLALNAQDAMPDGGRLSITTANVVLDNNYQIHNQDVRSGNYVLIAVTDNGTGMTKDVLDRVFEPFFTTKEVGKGSGLGLSMVYGFVKQSNGHVSVYSEPGLGTTARLYLPAITDGAEAAAAPDEAVDADASRGETVLIVEDDPFVRSYAVMCLGSLGYVAIPAIDGNDAMQRLAGDDPIDLLFTDIVMPGGLSGWSLAEAALVLRPDLRVLLTSGYALDTVAGGGRSGQRLPILTKPYRKADLAKRLREVLDAPAALQRAGDC
jgi:PAS domain S-box-containing protein